VHEQLVFNHCIIIIIIIVVVIIVIIIAVIVAIIIIIISSFVFARFEYLFCLLSYFPCCISRYSLIACGLLSRHVKNK
jgi:hypothetical protein